MNIEPPEFATCPIAIGEPEVSIACHQMAPKVFGQSISPVSRIRCMHQRHIRTLNLGAVKFRGGAGAATTPAAGFEAKLSVSSIAAGSGPPSYSCL
jgi:hypothetical protein